MEVRVFDGLTAREGQRGLSDWQISCLIPRLSALSSPGICFFVFLFSCKSN
jgi:hypothetical protein